jgi:hypothetical protein
VFDTHVDLLSGDCENVSAVWNSGGGQTGGQGGRKGWADQAIAACAGPNGRILGNSTLEGLDQELALSA